MGIDATYEVVSHSYVVIITSDKSHVVLNADIVRKDLCNCIDSIGPCMVSSVGESHILMTALSILFLSIDIEAMNTEALGYPSCVWVMVYGVVQCPVQLLGACSSIVLFPLCESDTFVVEDSGPEYSAIFRRKVIHSCEFIMTMTIICHISRRPS